MNDDTRKRKAAATKHYQNSEYPSGSFEAAIQADHEDRLRDAGGLRLERQPSQLPGDSHDDISEMVPAFMHRDFFRSEEDGLSAVVVDRDAAGYPIAPSASKPLSRLKIARRDSEAPPLPVAGPVIGGYMEPPNTEDDETEVVSARRATPPAPVTAPRSTERMEASAFAKFRAEAPPVESPVAESSLPPLRGQAAAPAPELRAQPAPAPLAVPIASPRAEAPAPVAPPQAEDPAPAATSASAKASPYSGPMIVALVMVLGIFVWREQTRPTIVSPEPLPVPVTVQSAAPSPLAAAEPSPAGTGFRPTFLAVGPPVPASLENVESSPTPGSGGEDAAGLFPTDGSEAAEETDAESARRAAVLERMSHGSETSSGAEASGDAETSSGSDAGAGELFPSTEEPVVSRPKPQAPVRSKPPARPAASAPKSEPKTPVAASAADLFPIDEELPIRPASRPSSAAAAPVAQPPVAAPAQSQPSGDPYQIDEPNL